MFPEKGSSTRRDVKETWICNDDKGIKREKVYNSSSGVSQPDYEKQLMNDLREANLYSINPQSGFGFDEKTEGGKTILSTKWYFNGGARMAGIREHMLCEVSLLFGKYAENKVPVEKLTIQCPQCVIPLV